MRVVMAELKDGFRTEIYMGKHELVADEPTDSGGTDFGPNPYDLMLAALGACTAMTVRWYGQKKGLDIGGCEVTLEYDRIHAKDCASCDKSEPLKRIEHIRRIVKISGRLTNEEKGRLATIPGKCPVSKTLSEGVVIEDQVIYA